MELPGDPGGGQQLVLTMLLSPASSVLENGTLSFTGPWAALAQGVLYLTQCCGHYNHTSCVGTA